MPKNVLVSGYLNPDLDAYACSAGYAELLQLQGQNAQGGCFGQPLTEVSYVLALTGEPQLEAVNPSDFASTIIVDTSDPYHIPEGIDLQTVIEVVDHHLYNDTSLFPNATLDIQAVGAAATLIVERFQAASITPRREIAALLYGAIVSNTLNFKAAVTTERDIAAAEWVKSLAHLPANFVSQLFKVKSDVTGDKLRELILLDMIGCEAGGKIFTIGQLELVGVPELLADRKGEIDALIEQLHAEQQANVAFMSLSDVELGKTYFLTTHRETQAVLEEVLGVPFADGVAEYPRIILRKEYVGPIRQRVLGAA